MQVNPAAGTAELKVSNLAEINYYSKQGYAGIISLGPNWQTAGVDATVSFDVVWNSPITRRVNIKDATDGFAGTFNEENNNNVTVSWSGSNALGFSFTSNVGNLTTSTALAPGNFFAQLAQERNGVFFPGGEPVLAAATPQLPVQQTLTSQQLQPVLHDAIAAWQAAGASPAQVAALNRTPVHIAALPSSYLGEEAAGQVWISPTAGGWGWYVDAAPAAPASPAAGKMDLLSVVAHEMGHVLGLEDGHDTQDVMGETLAPGVRRLPVASDLPAQLSSPSAVPVAVAVTVTLPAVSTPASNANPAAPLLLTPLALEPPALLDAQRQHATITLPLTPLLQASATGLLDDVFALVAAADPFGPYDA